MIELKNVSKTYQMGDITVQALRDVSLKIEQGEYVAIIGPSGSGKSTLMHILGFLDRPDTGAYTVFGEDVAKLKDDKLAILRSNVAGFVFQQFYLLPRTKAIENVELPLIYAGKKELRALAHEKLVQVELSERENHTPNELSGGQQQRVAIARALVNDPLVIFADEPTGNLDSKSKEEIMSILEGLNKKGKTIVMVTHEKEMAERAKRIITVFDGKIVSDVKKTDGLFLHKGERKLDAVQLFARKKTNFWSALFMDHLPQALKSIFSHKMRSALSMLGILIGVGAVIAMLALGKGAQQSMEARLASLGSNLLMLTPGSSNVGGVSLGAGAVTRFTLADAEALSKAGGSIKRVSPTVSGRAQVVFENKNWQTRVQSTGVDYAELHAANPEFGRFFTAEEVKSRAKVVVVGTTVVSNLFGNSDPVGRTIKINRINFSIIGVLPQKGSNGFQDQDDTMVIPVTTGMYRLLGKVYVDSIDVEAVSLDVMADAAEEIKQVIIKTHELKDDSSFQIRNMEDIQNMMKSVTNTMSMLLGSVAVISLLVGGIGIMNIMLVSVTERTKEIGLRKAIGAQEKDIMMQFLIEAIVMTVSGGIIGVIFGELISFIMAKLTGWPVIVTTLSIVVSTIFSATIGLIFGIFPARKAAKLNPIEALRFE
ncbi:MAG: MacB family efflux pump subunit [Candidatus Firestonebacteria bacterium RIFOXYC2_FULL_39_67]|nr:MAG: MacB family efflux pump subunit [Candidatus Firestonebacteria bacterium RIFOXYD2_FULL_39_29]OGF54164.1 MAG: MacB family efflux pump subunit [Candidatus Firestonebacteria bacterium RIFOXYC2_FULL_39_67]OGF57883.1 MAG: MacB family efflux pump subunit [Candidatus Firestonebacteria bacterium RifOxyC12_full_39_7]